MIPILSKGDPSLGPLSRPALALAPALSFDGSGRALNSISDGTDGGRQRYLQLLSQLLHVGNSLLCERRLNSQLIRISALIFHITRHAQTEQR